MATQPRALVSLPQYLAEEESSDVRREYFGGEVFEMHAVSSRHARLERRMLLGLSPQVDAAGCEMFGSRIRVATAKEGLYTYPDMTIVCGKPVFWDTKETLSNPKVIIEVLSPTTRDYDLGSKFENYRQLSSFREYLAVYQSEPKIVQRIKQADGSWLTVYVEGMDATLRLATIEAAIPLAEIYKDIEFDAVL